jgi:hypothetical protein
VGVGRLTKLLGSGGEGWRRLEEVFLFDVSVFFFLLNNKYFCFKLFGLVVLEFGRAPTPC